MISNPKNHALSAQNVQVDKIRYDDIDKKGVRRERHNFAETTFQDKVNIVPNIKLEYLDDFGRPQTPKEAFRSMSHSFHGKTSGKIKTEKRSRKMEEQAKVNSGVGDSDLMSVRKMHSKMKSENKYCVPLSGKNSIILAAMFVSKFIIILFIDIYLSRKKNDRK